MPRTSRSVAQRLASQSKSKKRRPRLPISTATSAIEKTIDASAAPDVKTDAEASLPPPAPEPIGGAPRRRSAAPPVERATSTSDRATSTSARSRTSAAARVSSTRTASRLATPRRPYSEYTAEYAYVTADLHRIALVAVLLIALLIVLSFIVQ
jgi:hypothetical protein